jgi:regulator of protease activity HflC (stomatin/prohibitin superfamily)
MTEPSSAPLAVLLCTTGVMLVALLLLIFMAIRVIPEQERLQVYRLGRYVGDKGPGIVILLPFIDRGVKYDVRQPPPFVQATPVFSSPPGNLVGQTGQTQTTVQMDGTVLVNGQTYDAISRWPVAGGKQVVVKRVVLEVEEVKDRPA